MALKLFFLIIFSFSQNAFSAELLNSQFFEKVGPVPSGILYKSKRDPKGFVIHSTLKQLENSKSSLKKDFAELNEKYFQNIFESTQKRILSENLQLTLQKNSIKKIHPNLWAIETVFNDKTDKTLKHHFAKYYYLIDNELQVFHLETQISAEMDSLRTSLK